ncbi:unnamed protein product [Prunus brigantina]
MSRFRPIGLCNTLYKVVSKILVNKLVPIMPKIISPNQVSFVPGSQIVDNVIIAQELLHKFRNSKGKKGFIAWKIDLSKAYDRLQWHFIKDVLWEAGLRGRVLELLMQCITTVKYQAILNGEVTESFQPACGIRQGDPLSPYIFVLCMEKLSHIINGAVLGKIWKPIKVVRGGPAISHLFFADDLILFAEAHTQQATIMHHCLETFCGLSGQQVNFDKSRIFCSPNTNHGTATQIASICGSPLTDSLGNYLGVPLIHSRVKNDTYSHVVAKVQQRLASWKSHTLSMAGRLVYLQAISSAIPIYSMQTVQFPISICDKLDRMNRDFLWGHNETSTKVHLVKWGSICKPKFMGGLGLKQTHLMNQALLAKSGWKLLQRDQGLWSHILNRKYLKNQSILNFNKSAHINYSNTWRGILFGARYLLKV